MSERIDYVKQAHEAFENSRGISPETLLDMYAKPAIAQWEAELAHQMLRTEDSEEYAAYQAGLNRKSLARAEQAEAENRTLRGMQKGDRARIADLKAENERLHEKYRPDAVDECVDGLLARIAELEENLVDQAALREADLSLPQLGRLS